MHNSDNEVVSSSNKRIWAKSNNVSHVHTSQTGQQQLSRKLYLTTHKIFRYIHIKYTTTDDDNKGMVDASDLMMIIYGHTNMSFYIWMGQMITYILINEDNQKKWLRLRHIRHNRIQASVLNNNSICHQHLCLCNLTSNRWSHIYLVKLGISRWRLQNTAHLRSILFHKHSISECNRFHSLKNFIFLK